MIEKMKKKKTNFLLPYLFLLPALIFFIIFFFIPIFKMLQLSMSKFSYTGVTQFTGLDNYQILLSDSKFWSSLYNTSIYTIIVVPGLVILSFFLALLVNVKVSGIKIFRLIYYIPVVTSMVIVGVIWKWLYQSDGLLNSMLQVFNIAPVPWLNSTDTAMLSVCLVTLWKSTAYYMVIYLGGLLSIDSSLYEAASIDGVSWWQQIIYITEPLMRPFTLVVVSISTINAFRIFGEVFILTQGGPAGSTEVLTTYVYKLAFNNLNMGYASTVAVVLLVITMILSAINFKFFSRGGHVN